MRTGTTLTPSGVVWAYDARPTRTTRKLGAGTRFAAFFAARSRSLRRLATPSGTLSSASFTSTAPQRPSGICSTKSTSSPASSP